MKNLKVVKIENETIVFDDGTRLSSSHIHECCEFHFLCFSDVKVSDFDGLSFNLTNEKFFNRIKGYGIELKPIKGFSVKIAGYSSNNGCYGSNIDLLISDKDGKKIKSYDVSECQDWVDGLDYEVISYKRPKTDENE